jgi:hydroxyacylglutathione hydrolase
MVLMAIPLEDNFNDIIGKAQRGFELDDDHLARKAGVSVSDLGRVQSGQVVEEVIRLVARTLELGEHALVDSARKAWYPNPQEVECLATFHTRYEDITVNAYLVWDPSSRAAAIFDTGADAGPMLELIRAQDLSVTHLLLTHTHGDHIADLGRLKSQTGALAFVSEKEPIGGTESFAEGRVFEVGGL